MISPNPLPPGTVQALRLNPAFAAVAVASLALGIGANTAIFSLIDAVLLRSLAVSEPQRLVFLSDRESAGVSIGTQSGARSLFTYEEFEFLRANLGSQAAMCAAESSPARLNARLDGGAVEEVRGKLVTHDYFAVLGVAPVLGRAFAPAEDAGPGTGPVAVLGYDFWRARFNRDPSVVGRTIAPAPPALAESIASCHAVRMARRGRVPPSVQAPPTTPRTLPTPASPVPCGPRGGDRSAPARRRARDPGSSGRG
jgi:hypothetical protein